MARGEDEDRAVVLCAACRTAYAARELPDGTLLPIGARETCSCGNAEFVEVDSESVFGEHNPIDRED